MRPIFFLLLFVCFWTTTPVYSLEHNGATPTLQFRADHYERDLGTKLEKGIGKAWIKYGSREIWADEIELDREKKKATANGNVHLKENNIDIFCDRAVYALDGSEANLEEATLLAGQMVVTGSVLTQLGPNHYEIRDGVYTNCNTIPITDRSASRCLFDWKLYGHRFDLTLDGYVLAYDVILYSKDLPITYLPFFMAPAKSKRQTGFLFSSISSTNYLGTGVSLPFFWAIGSWHDLTITPTYFTKSGTHVGLEYNYIYNDNAKGGFSLFYNASSFNAARNHPEVFSGVPGVDSNYINKPKILGFAGELALSLKNTLIFKNGLVAKQSVNYVSDPFYVQAFPNDIGLSKSNLGYLRSQATWTYPKEHRLFYGGIIHHQSLIVSTDTSPTTLSQNNADRGAVTQLPHLGIGQKLTDLIEPYLALDYDLNFKNFWRPNEAFDNNQPLPGNSDITLGAPYHDGDFIRTGQRFQFKPKLTAQIPLTMGLELQPVVKANVSAYRFTVPDDSTQHQESINTEIPFSFYLFRNFNLNLKNFEKITHLIQPRLSYGSSLYQSATPSHPFFNSSQPHFDSTDFVGRFEYFKFDLIQRFRRVVNNHSTRFITFQLSNQYNSRLDQIYPGAFDPTLKHHLGPLQGYLNLNIDSFSATVEGYYQWEKDSLPGGPLRNESSWTSTLAYEFGAGDSISLGSLNRHSVDPNQDEQLFSIGLNKSLPIFVNLSLNANYSAKRGELRSYEWGTHFASKPTSCWSLSVLSGKTQARQTYARFIFQLNFGGSVAKP